MKISSKKNNIFSFKKEYRNYIGLKFAENKIILLNKKVFASEN